MRNDSQKLLTMMRAMSWITNRNIGEALAEKSFMKTNHVSGSFSKIDNTKKRFTFGDLIVSVYDACGKRRATGILRLALKAGLVEFGELPRFSIPKQKQGANWSL